MKPLTIKTGLAIGGIAFGLGLKKIPKLNKIKVIRKFADKSKNFGLLEGERIVKSIAKEIDPDPYFINMVFDEFCEVVVDIIKFNDQDFYDEELYDEEHHKDKGINVVFLEDEEDEIKLLSSGKKHIHK